jgi:16S rRNA (cytosine967-C5)-methyltransferase
MNAGAKSKAEDGKQRPLVSVARLAAFNVLRRVEEEDAYAALVLAASEEKMRADDRALCYELVLGTLRRQLWLDRLIEHYAGRSAAGLDAPVRRVLRLGLYQLRFLSRIPASAVVNESVKLVHRARLRSAAAFTNAVLRRATREPLYDPAADISDSIERLAVETSHPAWLIERWIKAFGRDEAEAFARANNDAPPVAFRVIARRASAEEVLDEVRAAGGIARPSQIAPEAWRVQGATPVLQTLAREGKIYLQDEASQLVAHVLDARDGERILDVCAAPGSKTTHIAARTPNLSLIVAGDVHEHRAQTLVKTGAQQGVERLRVVIHDAEIALPYFESSFDRVLVDAPCTGTGTLRRNPEIRWRISRADIQDLSVRQRRILASAARMVRPGGHLVYSTCSVEPLENEEVVARFLSENDTFNQVAVNASRELLGENGAARTWPHKGGADGFFIASFERRS